MLTRKSTYDEVYRSFAWSVPEYYNIGADVCDKWAEERTRLALIYEDEEGKARALAETRVARLSPHAGTSRTKPTWLLTGAARGPINRPWRSFGQNGVRGNPSASPAQV